MRSVFFHEDDYCQIELISAENRQWCDAEMSRIDDFSRRHLAEVGWTDVYALSEPPVRLVTVGISRSEFAEAMPASMPLFDRVSTGYSTSRVECRRTMAFGPHESLVAFCESDTNGIVTAAWFTFDLRTSDDVAKAVELGTALSKWPLLIADWGWSRLLRLTDADALASYFTERVNVFGDTSK